MLRRKIDGVHQQPEASPETALHQTVLPLRAFRKTSRVKFIYAKWLWGEENGLLEEVEWKW